MPRPAMVFAALVVGVVAVSYGIGAWQTSGRQAQPGHADPQAVCERWLDDDCPGAARDTCGELLAQARRNDAGADGGSGQGLTFVRCRHDE